VSNIIRQGSSGYLKVFISMICVMLVGAVAKPAIAQKVKVGYDKSADFSRYRSYTWLEPSSQPTRPILYSMVVGSIDHELKSKGLERIEGDGDLVLVPEGGIEVGLSSSMGSPIPPNYNGPPPAMDASMWTGSSASVGSSATYVPNGSLALNFVDRSTNKVVWSGSVKVGLDIERKKKSLEKVDAAIAKLLKSFPPNRK
jgi:hypothetical protein